MDSNLMILVTKSDFKEMIKDAVSEIGTSKEIKTPEEVVSPQFLSISDMCGIFKVSRVTISTWMKQGRIPFKKVSRRVYFVLSEVMEALPQFNLASVQSFQKSLKQGVANDGRK